MKKQFTPSERVAILETIERMKLGGDRRSPDFQSLPVDDVKTAAKSVGFGSISTAYKSTERRSRPTVKKEFTPSERVAILETIERMKVGNPDFSNRPRVDDLKTAAKSVGFGSRSTAHNAKTVVERGVPELVEAMDLGQIGIRPAAAIARLPQDEQRRVVALPRQERAARTETPVARRPHGRRLRKITLPYSAAAAAITAP